MSPLREPQWPSGPLESDSRSVRIGPHQTAESIAQLCRDLSTDDTEVYARIEWLGGAPVAYLVRVTRQVSVPMLLRDQAG